MTGEDWQAGLFDSVYFLEVPTGSLSSEGSLVS